MAYEKGTATSLADLLGKLNTFATANGWTLDEFDTTNGDWALSKGDIFVSGRWDTVSPQHLSLHQALGFSGAATLPGNHTGDSGNGYNATSSHADNLLDDERHVSDLGPGPYGSYHFFEQDSGPTYLHVVAQIQTGVFRHFGFGDLIEVGTWTGGAYCYGHQMDTSLGHSPISISETCLLDGLYQASGVPLAATVHVQGLTNQPGAGRWGTVSGASLATSVGTDTAGNARERLRGGYRGGPVARMFGIFNGSALTGLIPAYEIPIFHRDSVSTTRVRLLGYMPDVRGINIRNFAAEEEVTIDGETWVLIPLGLRTSDNVSFRTYFSGIAYRKETA